MKGKLTPSEITLLNLLKSGPKSFSQLIPKMDISAPTVYKALAGLDRLGYVTSENMKAEGKGSINFYSLSPNCPVFPDSPVVKVREPINRIKRPINGTVFDPADYGPQDVTRVDTLAHFKAIQAEIATYEPPGGIPAPTPGKGATMTKFMPNARPTRVRS